MTDRLTPKQRSLHMARIKGADTAPELALRRGLHAERLRFRLHGRNLPGRPDLVFASHHAVVFVHGCFWHSHDDCVHATVPKTRPEFWRAKLAANKARDARITGELCAGGWRVLIVWECALKSAKVRPATIAKAALWIRSRSPFREIPPASAASEA